MKRNGLCFFRLFHALSQSPRYAGIHSDGSPNRRDPRVAMLPTLLENQEVTLNASPITIRKPASDSSLILLANVDTNFRDCRFRVFSTAENFGGGTQTITVYKVYWLPPDYRITNKPTKSWMAAYEVTVEVNVPTPQNSPPPPTSPFPPTPPTTTTTPG
jgi:hypothetical protein